MVAVPNSGIHFTDPWEFLPYTVAAASAEAIDNGGTVWDSSTTAFFTEMARRGLQEQTNWTADTYKTLLSVSSGKGLVAAVVGPTAGGASTTTFEFTVDGVLTEIAVPDLASGERAILTSMGMLPDATFTTAVYFGVPGGEALDSNKQVFGGVTDVASKIPTWYGATFMGLPMLKFKRSLLIRAKHSASITNSTATAYSAIMYRLGL